MEVEQPMRLAYNFSTQECVYYNPMFEDFVLFGTFEEDDEDPLAPFITTGDAYSTYDVSHWTSEDLEEFSRQAPLDQIGQLAGLTEIVSV